MTSEHTARHGRRLLILAVTVTSSAMTLPVAWGQTAVGSQPTQQTGTISGTSQPAPAEAASSSYTTPEVTISTSPIQSSGINISNWPHPVQVFTAKDLSANGPANLTETLNEQATGVNLVNSQANPYQPSIIYHGFQVSPIQGTPEGLSVYVNGVRFNQPFGDVAIWSLLPDEAISSMTLEDGNPVFGLNALGGAINVQMKNGFNYHGGELEVSGGSFDRITGNLEYGKQAGNVAAYVDIGETHEAGWRDLQSSDIQNFYGDLGWRNDHASLHINLTMANSGLNGPGTVPVQILDADPSSQFTGPNQIADKYLKLGTSFNDQLTADTSLQVVAYYQNLLERLINGNGPSDLPCGLNPDAADLCQDGGTGSESTTKGGAPIPNFLPTQNAYNYFAYSQEDVSTTNTNGYGGSVQLTNTTPVFGLANNLVGGLSYDGGDTKYDAAAYDGGITDDRVYYTPPGIPNPGYLVDEPGAVPVDVVIRNAYYGAYLTDTLDLTNKLALTMGGRFNIANIDLHDQNPPDPNSPGVGLNGGHYYMHFNPTIGATYKVMPALTLYGSYSEANAAPTPAELSCASPEDSCDLANFMSGDPNLKQIVVRTFEAGLRGATLGPGNAVLSYNIDYYHSVTNDDIEFMQSPVVIGTGYFSNVGNVLRQGADFGARLDADRWNAFLSYSLTEATYQSSFIEQSSNNPGADANGDITIMPGDHLPGIPQNLIKWGAGYKVTPKWTIGFNAYAQTSSFLFGDEANLDKPLPGYFVLNLTTNYQITPKLEFFGEIDNVTDTTYYNYGTYSPLGSVYVAQDPNYSDPRSYSIAAPIGVFAGVRLKL
jgi:outer membrane receptor protein involved in Fe transport